MKKLICFFKGHLWVTDLNHLFRRDNHTFYFKCKKCNMYISAEICNLTGE